MSIIDALSFFKNISLSKNEKKIGERIINDIINRLNYLNELGLGYLTLERRCNTLSGVKHKKLTLQLLWVAH